MARNRQRAKARKQKLHRENIPGSLDHASGEVEEVEAAIVAGAGGTPVEPAADDVAAEPDDVVERDGGEPVDDELLADDEPELLLDDEPELLLDDEPELLLDDEPELLDDDEPELLLDDEPANHVEDLDDDDDEVGEERLGTGAGDVALPPRAHKPAGFRVTNFFRACWAELQRVDWPDRRQVGQATAVVLGFVVVAGAFLGFADVVAQRIVDFIL